MITKNREIIKEIREVKDYIKDFINLDYSELMVKYITVKRDYYTFDIWVRDQNYLSFIPFYKDLRESKTVIMTGNLDWEDINKENIYKWFFWNRQFKPDRELNRRIMLKPINSNIADILIKFGVFCEKMGYIYTHSNDGMIWIYTNIDIKPEIVGISQNDLYSQCYKCTMEENFKKLIDKDTE